MHPVRRYVIALRPYTSAISLSVEVLVSCIEVVILSFCLANQLGQAVSSPPAVVAGIVLWIGVRVAPASSDSSPASTA